MNALIGNLFEPLPNLRVDIGKIDERAQRPEVFPKIADAVFNFAFFPSGSIIAGSRVKAQLTGKCQEPRIELNNSAVMFCYSSRSDCRIDIPWR